jgi:hypothetical protein
MGRAGSGYTQVQVTHSPTLPHSWDAVTGLWVLHVQLSTDQEQQSQPFQQSVL